MKKVATKQDDKIKKDVRKNRNKTTSIETIVMEKKDLGEQEDMKVDYEWLNSLIIAMPDEVVREKVNKLFSNCDDKEVLVEKLIMEIL